MKELLNSLSSDNLVLLCVIMGIVALFLAIAISIEIYNNNKRYQKLLEKNDDDVKEHDSSTLNIKKSEGIKYVEEDSELEKTKAKMELANLREKLKKEEEEKNKAFSEIESDSSIKKNDDDILDYNDSDSKLQDTIKIPSINGNEVIEDNKKEIVEESKDIVLENTEIVESTEQEEVKHEEKKKLNLNIDNYLSKDIIRNPKNVSFSIEKPSISKELDTKVEVGTAPVVEDIVDNSSELGDSFISDIDSSFDSYESEDNTSVNDTIQNIDDTAHESLANNNFEYVPRIDLNYSKPNINDDSSEEDAIISYDELKNATSFGYTDEEMDEYLDEKDAIISIQELEKLYKESSNVVVEDKVEELENTNVLKTESLFDLEIKDLNNIANLSNDDSYVSTIYEDTVKDRDLALKQTANLERLNDEIKKTNEFLKTLKDLKKNLE